MARIAESKVGSRIASTLRFICPTQKAKMWLVRWFQGKWPSFLACVDGLERPDAADVVADGMLALAEKRGNHRSRQDRTGSLAVHNEQSANAVSE